MRWDQPNQRIEFPFCLTFLLSASEQRLEMRRLLFARDHTDFDLLEIRCFEPALKITLCETQPTIAIKFVCFLEFVLEQIENEKLSARLENSVCGLDRVFRFFRMMQRLTQNHEINASWINGRVLQIA